MSGPIYGLTFAHRAIENGMNNMVANAKAVKSVVAAEQLNAFHDNMEKLDKLLSAHAAAEDAELFPAIDAKQPDAASSFYADHENEIAKFADIKSAFAASDAGDEDWKTAISMLKEYTRFTVAHMQREEAELFPIILQHYSVAEQAEIMKKIGAFFKPAELVEIMPWMVTQLIGEQRTGYINLIKMAMPAPVYEMAKGWIKDGVSDDVWGSIEGVM